MKHLSKTFFLTRFYLRKDWVSLLSWIGMMTVMVLGVGLMFPSKYPHEANRAVMIQTLKLPSMKAILGPIQNSTTTISNMFVSEMSLWCMLIMGIFAILIANGNTRKQEDTGLLELMQSRCVGRFAPLLATFNELVLVNGIITLILGFGMSAINMTGSDVAGDWVFAGLMGMAGLFFGTMTILLAQITNDSSQNVSTSFGVFVGFYVIFIGLMTHDKWHFDWLTPFSVIRKTEIYHHNVFWPLLVVVAVSVVMFAISFYLASIRDEGSGLLPTIPGKKTSWFLKNYPALVIDTQLKSSIIWFIMLAIFGAVYGSVLGSIQKIVTGNAAMLQVLQTQADDAAKSFIFIIGMVFAVISTIPGILTIFKLESDQKRGIIELILARPVHRTTIFLANTLIGTVISLLGFASYEAGLYFAQKATMKYPFPRHDFISVYASYLAPMLVVLAIAVFMIVWVPKLSKSIWAILYLIIFINFFGAMIKLSHIWMHATLFGLVKRSFTHALATNQIWMMLLVALVLWLVSLFRYRKIDL
ncbi:ABC transporter permease [Fructilactobacillus sp. Tb1]|uniref:ABC transporter permease n=1 Tax=Fructilactobacillus sp. Tb1 TaxID=3422304 RepID=UPI003D2ADB95